MFHCRGKNKRKRSKWTCSTNTKNYRLLQNKMPSLDTFKKSVDCVHMVSHSSMLWYGLDVIWFDRVAPFSKLDLRKFSDKSRLFVDNYLIILINRKKALAKRRANGFLFWLVFRVIRFCDSIQKRKKFWKNIVFPNLSDGSLLLTHLLSILVTLKASTMWFKPTKEKRSRKWLLVISISFWRLEEVRGSILFQIHTNYTLFWCSA